MAAEMLVAAIVPMDIVLATSGITNLAVRLLVVVAVCGPRRAPHPSVAGEALTESTTSTGPTARTGAARICLEETNAGSGARASDGWEGRAAPYPAVPALPTGVGSVAAATKRHILLRRGM